MTTQNLETDPNKTEQNAIMSGPGQGMMMPGQGMMMPGQGMMMPGQGMMMPGQGMMMPGQGMMMPGQNMMMGPYPGMNGFLYFTEDPMKELLNSSGAIIRQEVEMFEVITGCETQNRYQVFIQTPMGLKYAFQCNEKSGCCSRCCCSDGCRGLEIDIRHITSPGPIVSEISNIYIRAVKPCGCGFLCCCRPHMDIILQKNRLKIGSVREPFTCCDKDAEVYDKDGNLKYRMIGDCCQIGFCCGSSAEKIVAIEFKIVGSDGNYVGMMKKMGASGPSEYFSKADSYTISFPSGATPEEKMLLICAGLLIDYQNFENDTSEKNRGKQGF